jgi:xanthine dehydrogenase small subunit
VEPQLVVNGTSLELGDVGGHVTLLEWLRESGFTGSKEGCAEGECGACAVLVAKPNGEGTTRWTAINACLVPAAALDGQEVVTAEGLGQPGELHPVQQEMAVRGGSQCGYCTPGFICSMASEYYRPERHPGTPSDPEEPVDPAEAAIAHDHEHGANGFDLHSLSGNLCRCTGYRPIRDAAYALGEPAPSDPFLTRLDQPAPAPVATHVTSSQGAFVRPADLGEALNLLAEHPKAVLVAGSTDWGVELNIRHARADLSIGIDRLTELRGLSITDDFIELGAALTLTEIERALDGQVPLLADLFPQFASRLIRNGATLGGNLGTASPIGDTPPGLLALDCTLVLASREGEREVALADYFTGYRQTVKRPDELIRTVRIPLPLAPITAFHKIAKRRFDDISSVAIAFALRLDGADVADIKIGLGGVAATPLRANETEAALNGRPWTEAVVAQAAEVLGRAGTPMTDHRASSDYRTAMLKTSLLKFYAENAASVYQEA